MADFDKSTFDPKAAAEARKKELDQMAQKLEAGVRKLLLPDGALILPVIPDRIILVKDNKTMIRSISRAAFSLKSPRFWLLP